MADVILAGELCIGDVFFDPKRLPMAHSSAIWGRQAGLRRVRAIRGLNVGSGSYSIIDWDGLSGKNTGVLDLRFEVAVARVQPYHLDEAMLRLSGLPEGEVLTAWHEEGRIWL